MTRAQAAALLGVPVDADRAAVQRAFLKRARLVHPDALPDADDAGRSAAADRFDALARARAVLESPAPPAPPVRGTAPAPSAQPSAGIGNGLLLLVLLVFLLVALVTLDVAIRTNGFEDSSMPGPTASSAPA